MFIHTHTHILILKIYACIISKEKVKNCLLQQLKKIFKKKLKKKLPEKNLECFRLQLNIKLIVIVEQSYQLSER